MTNSMTGEDISESYSAREQRAEVSRDLFIYTSSNSSCVLERTANCQFPLRPVARGLCRSLYSVPFFGYDADARASDDGRAAEEILC